jgi:hypothetical protein
MDRKDGQKSFFFFQIYNRAVNFYFLFCPASLNISVRFDLIYFCPYFIESINLSGRNKKGTGLSTYMSK